MKLTGKIKYCCVLAVMALSAMGGGADALARTYTHETLNYQIVYHWGMIWKHAANASLSIKQTSNGYTSQLVGATRSWADKVYPVRDTLRCYMNSNLRPLRYEKITHEKDHYGKDIVQYSYNYSDTHAKCTRIRLNKPTQTINLSCRTQAYDMVSVFYMLRNMNYEALSQSKVYTTIVFSGKRKEFLTIRYKGLENVKLRDGSKRKAYHIVFKFTQDGGKKSSDDIDAWMSEDASRIPLLLVGKLPVGEVKCYYAG